MRKGATRDEFPSDDYSSPMFREQNKRTLDEIDVLLQRQRYLAEQLGSEKAAEIELNPDLFYNTDRFRIYQAKARTRALVASAVALPAIFTVMNNGRDGIGYVNKNYGKSAAISAAFFVAAFAFFYRRAGFNNQVYSEQTYAKNVKMLRNLIIKQ